MSHLTEEDLVLYYYREAPDQEAARLHLESCEACGEAYREIERVLELSASVPVPERSSAYGAEVWARIEQRLERRVARRFWWRWPALAAVAAGVAALAVFVAEPDPGPAPVETTVAAPGRDAVLRMAIGEHLERSERFLVEVLNDGTRDQAEQAEDLLHSNRLLRQTVENVEMPEVSGVLDELEFLLAETAHSGNGREVARFGGPEVLFKVRTVNTRLVSWEVTHATGL